MGDTSIEWTEKTWNPIRGCTRVSEGCRNCYAEREANRHKGPGDAYEGLVQITNGHPQWTGKIRFVEEHLEDPLHWRDPRLVFVNSMSDLFHDGVTEDWLDRIFAVMALAKDHTFQVLTKRPARMLEYCSRLQQREVAVSLAITRNPWWDGPQASPCAVGAIEDRIAAGPLPNVWLGVSAENQATADERIPLLLQTPAAVRWVSAEPLLGPIDLTCAFYHRLPLDALPGWALNDGCTEGVARNKPGDDINWIVVGGESGPGARPMHPAWPRSILAQCQAAGVPFFYKQNGEWHNGSVNPRAHEITMYSDGRYCDFTQEAIIAEEQRSGKRHNDYLPTLMSKVGKKAAGRLLDGKEWSEYPIPGAQGGEGSVGR